MLGLEYAQFRVVKFRLVVSHSSRRAKKDQSERGQAIERLLKRLKNSDRPKQWLSIRGYARYLKLTDDAHAKVEMNEDSIAQQAIWDGLHGIATNLDLSKTNPMTAL